MRRRRRQQQQLLLLVLCSRCRMVKREKEEKQERGKELVVRLEVRASGGIGSPAHVGAHSRVCVIAQLCHRPGREVPRAASRWSRW